MAHAVKVTGVKPEELPHRQQSSLAGPQGQAPPALKWEPVAYRGPEDGRRIPLVPRAAKPKGQLACSKQQQAALLCGKVLLLCGDLEVARTPRRHVPPLRCPSDVLRGTAPPFEDHVARLYPRRVPCA